MDIHMDVPKQSKTYPELAPPRSPATQNDDEQNPSWRAPGPRHPKRSKTHPDNVSEIQFEIEIEIENGTSWGGTGSGI